MSVRKPPAVKRNEEIATQLPGRDNHVMVGDDVELREIGEEGKEEDIEDKYAGVERG